MDGLPPSRVSALAISSMCDRVLTWYKPEGSLGPDEVAEAFWVLARGMLRLENAPNAVLP